MTGLLAALVRRLGVLLGRRPEEPEEVDCGWCGSSFEPPPAGPEWPEWEALFCTEWCRDKYESDDTEEEEVSW